MVGDAPILQSGPRLSPAPSADPGDGLLDVVLVPPGGRDALAALAGASPVAPPPAVRGRRIALRVPPGVPLHLDDDPWDPPRDGDGWAAVELEGGAGAVEVPVPGRR